MSVIGEMLWIERGDGAAIAHRCLRSGKPALAVLEGRRQRAVRVHLLDRREDRIIPVAELADGQPLTAAEEAEYDHLDAKLAGTNGDARDWRRFNALRLRSLIYGSAVPA